MSFSIQVRTSLFQRAKLFLSLTDSDDFFHQVERVGDLLLAALRTGNKILIFGNGGSASQAQHFASELVVRFEKSRRPIPALAIGSDPTQLTAQANDFGFSTSFARPVEAYCKSGDIVIGITTSDASDDHSVNIREGFAAARRCAGTCVGFFSMKTQNLLPYVDAAIVVPHTSTALIQEIHGALIHIFSGFLEREIA